MGAGGPLQSAGVELTLTAVVGVVCIVVVAAFSERLGVAAPLSLVVVGIGLSFVPGVPRIAVRPEWILAGVLPPLLYSTAITMPAVDFRRNLKAISGLGVLLVVVSTLGAGALAHGLLPGIGWPAAFALGAVISPTDAVAATSVGKRVGLPHRLLTVLEGEGLVNDASALVLLRSAVAAVAGAVSLWGVAGQFLYSVVAATVIGLVVGVLNVRARGLLNDAVFNTAISLVVPFIAYLPAEQLHASGVLAVVVAGLVTGHESPRRLRADHRVAESVNWRTLSFLLESGIFFLMGLSLKTLTDAVARQHSGVLRAILVGLAVSALVILARMVFTAPLVALLRRDERRAERTRPRLDAIQTRLDELDGQGRFSARQKARFDRRLGQVTARVTFLLRERLGWRGGVVLAWSGMRGAVTVAAAQTLPDDTPARPVLVLVAFVVAATTLLLQGSTLPAVIRLVRVPGDDPAAVRDEYRRLLVDLGRAATAVLDEPGPGYRPVVVDRVRDDAHIRTDDGGERPPPADADAENREQYVRLRLAVLEAERQRLLDLRGTGTYSSAALTHAQRALDVDTIRLQQLGA